MAMEPKEIVKLVTAALALVTLVLCFTLFKGHPDLIAVLVPGCIATVAAIVVPSKGVSLPKRSIPPGPLALLLIVALLPHAGCGGSQRPPPEKVGMCLIRLYDRIYNREMGGPKCQDIVQAVAQVVAEDSACSELVLHGLQCEGRDGG